MKTNFFSFRLKHLGIILFTLICSGVLGQAVPEYMYYKFDAAGNQTNYASAPVGNNPATLDGLTVGSTGQFGTALIGNGLASGTNRLNTGWATNLPSTGWTISFWLNNFPATAATTYYYFGDASAGTFRCFTGGVAGNGNLWLRGTGFTDVPINAIPATPTVIHLVYNGSSVRVFFNGVFNSAVAQAAVTFTGAGPFLVGGYSTSNSINAGTLMDEFRMYNRALSDAEVGSTWNQPLPIVSGGPPIVTTTAATAVGFSSATLNGTVNANGASSTVTFNYGLTTLYGSTAPGVPSPVTGTTATAVSAAITSLLPNTLYHFKCCATNSYGTTCGSDMTFTTSPALTLPYTQDWETTTAGSTTPPTNWGTDVVGGSNITWFQSAGTWPVCTPYSGARMVEFQSFSYGSTYENRLKLTTPFTTTGLSTIIVDFRWLVDPGYNITPCDRVNVQYSLNGTSWITVGTFNRYAATQAWTYQSVQLPAACDNQATVYVAFDFISQYGNNCHLDDVHIFQATAPTIVTNAASGVAITTATLNGTATANGLSSTVGFNYGLTTLYGSNATATQSPVIGTTATAISAAVSGLLPGTLYHFRATGTNSKGTTNGGDLTFTTSPDVPAVVTTAATGVNATGATMNGTVNANGSSSTVFFDYGLTTTYGTTVGGTPSPVTGATVTPVSATLTGLLTNQTYHYRVRATNSLGTSNGTDMTFLTVCPIAGPAGPISGPTQVCQGGSGYVYTVTIPNATGYVWTLPVGGTITAGAGTSTITVSYAANAAPGYLMVYGTAACGNGAPSLLGIAVNPPATPTITGPASVCVNSTGNVYTTQAGMGSYSWTVSAGGAITGGGSTNAITVTWSTTGAKTVTVNYQTAAGCWAIAPTSYSVTVNPLPTPTISGPSPACSSFPGLVYSTQAGMTGYTWTISAGGTITGGAGTSTITVTWNAIGAQSVSVNYTNANGCTAAAAVTYPVTVNSGAAPTITGPNNLCVNSGYNNYTTQPGMSGYTWTISSGGIINYGSGTNVITVSWTASGAQWVAVNYTNPGGCSAPTATQFNVTVNPLPGPAGSITGTATVCGGANGVAYSTSVITGASTYVWTLPTGATIASGAGTNAITVNFAGNASSGNITVVGNNMCGSGTVSPNFNLTVNPIPAAAVVSNTGYTANSSAAAGNQWYYSTTATGTGAPISGATSQTYDATLTGTGYYWVVVTISGCPSAESNRVLIITTGVENHTGAGISLYPVPNDGKFTVTFSSNDTYTISVFSNIGVKIWEEKNVEVNASTSKVIDLRPVPNGVYTLIFENSQNQVVKKIVVNK